MNAEMVARIIQLILAPVVMITACAILQGGLLSHYASINERMRAMSRERLELLWGKAHSGDDASSYTRERKLEIDKQLPELTPENEKICL